MVVAYFESSWKQADVSAPIQNPGGRYDLYFVFVKPNGKNLLLFEWIDFEAK